MTSRKTQRMRGSKTHGGGAMKKRRGAGNRGGRGRAGSGKKGDAKKPSYWKEERSKGFSSLGNDENIINIAKLNENVKEPGIQKIDLGKIGYTKLLGTGKPAFEFHITVPNASSRAISKIEKAGGKVITNAEKTEGE